MMLICCIAIIPGIQAASADSAPPVALLYPLETVSVQPNQPVYVQVAALGWSGVEIREGTQVVGSSTGSGPNHSVAVTFQTEGVHILEAVGTAGPIHSAPRRLPPIMVKAGAVSIADIVPIARQMSIYVPDFNGDGNTADKRNDLKAALGLIRPPAHPEPVSGYVIQPGSEFGAIRIDYVPQSGSQLYYELTASSPDIPSVGSTVQSTLYGPPGTDILGANGYTYLALSEADAQGKVIRFSRIKLHDAMFMSSLTGRVLDWNDSPFHGATLEFRAGADNTTGNVVATTSVDGGTGEFSVDLPVGDYTVKLIAAGYEQSLFSATASRSTTNSYIWTAISELQPDQIRIVLTWGAGARDLDSHLLGPDGNGGIFHLYYANKVTSSTYGEIAKLDRDDTYYNGTETVTVTTVNRNVYGTFNYYVNNYSWNEGSLRGSGAKVEVYVGSLSGDGSGIHETLIKSYMVPTGLGQERYWEVLHLIVSENEVLVEDRNQLRETSPILTKITGADTSGGSLNSFRLYYLSDANQVQTEDLQISATLDGLPYVLGGLHYNSSNQIITFDPVPTAESARQLVVTVNAAPSSKRLIPGAATATFTIPAAKTAITGLNMTLIGSGLDYKTFKADLTFAYPTVTGLTYDNDLSVTASVYNTVTGATYANTALANVALNPDGSGWSLTFDLNRLANGLPYNTGMLLTLTVTAKPSSAAITGSATYVTAFDFPLLALGESNPFAALALMPPPMAGVAPS
ncbi:hypothetical protein FE783_22045 [Paenibacillus mesophilus]|uniref:hypothetical protein n=1 Tax=Paenibacillus mesophilus TaxID=2582849 RepID=UPI00110EEC18|nr:hypothetical protein [Paenibacillus mesophilus]TMV47292.1 hypothetical protein FE783_22045 [Paenibacillus mesophilus]